MNTTPGTDPSKPKPTPAPAGFKFSDLYPDVNPNRAEELRHQNKLNDLRSDWGAGSIHVKCKPERVGKWGESLSATEQKLGTGFTIAIVGIGGRGKTQMGVELMKIATEKERSARLVSATAFFNRIKSTYRKSSEEGERDVIEEFLKPSLLVIDEFDKRAENDWQANQMFELLNDRYRFEKDTFIIDNRTTSEFLASVGSAIAQRMTETGGVIEANWESFRK